MADLAAPPVRPAAPAPAAARDVALGERLLRWGGAVAVVVVVLQTIGHLVDWLATGLDIVLLNADSDQSIYPWIPVVAIFTGALALFLQQLVRPETGFRRWLPAVLAYLSLDEMVAIHERLTHILKKLHIAVAHAREIWPVIYLPLMAATAVALWRMARSMSPRARLFVQTGLVFLATAVVLEAISAKLVDVHPTAYQIEVIVEQDLELAGWTLIGTALLSFVFVSLLRATPEDVSA
jgi:hypothetical protein